MNNLSDRIWWTKKARIKAEKRLLNFEFYSQLILLWYSFFLICASIYELKKPSLNDDATISMIALSVLVFAATLFISTRNFKERAMLVKQCYEQLSILLSKSKIEGCDFVGLESEYQNILSISENHKESDFNTAVVSEYYYSTKDKRDALNKKPTCIQIISVVLNKTFYLAYILFLLSCPIIIYSCLRLH